MKKSELFFIFILLPLDIAMIIASFAFAYYLRVHIEVGEAFSRNGFWEYLRYALYLIPIWIAIFALAGLYKKRTDRGQFEEIYKIFISNSVVMLFLTLILFFTRTTFFSRFILLSTWIISLAFIGLARIILNHIQIYLLKFGIGRRNVLLIGGDQVTSFIANEIRKNPSLGMKVIGVVSDDAKSGEVLKYLGNISDLQKIIKERNIDQIIASEAKISQTKITRIIETCFDKSVALSFVPAIFSAMTVRVKNDVIGSMPILDVQTIALDGWGRIIKRILDLVFAVICFVIASPLILIIALLEKITSKGPVFYSHERIGRDGKKFKVYKFRSMYAELCDFSNGGSKWTTKDDERNRITPLGRIIRKTNLDEIPQFWNILIGNMSFVGPRPEQPKFVQKFEREIPEYYKRHRVKSGLTGWAQVNGLKGDTSIVERARYDMYYIENWSIWFDFIIMIKTFLLIIYEIFGGKYEYRTRT